MDQLNKCEDRISTLETAQNSLPGGALLGDRNTGTGLKCVAYGLLAVAHAIRELAEVFNKGINKSQD